MKSRDQTSVLLSVRSTQLGVQYISTILKPQTSFTAPSILYTNNNPDLYAYST